MFHIIIFQCSLKILIKLLVMEKINKNFRFYLRMVSNFEKKFAKYIGAKYVVSTNIGTCTNFMFKINWVSKGVSHNSK